MPVKVFTSSPEEMQPSIESSVTVVTAEERPVAEREGIELVDMKELTPEVLSPLTTGRLRRTEIQTITGRLIVTCSSPGTCTTM